MLRLSICITTYNQSDLVKANLDEISKYKGDDIEVVVSDNCSEEDIGSLVNSYNDNRFHHFRNSKNEGQDGNILFGFSKCKGKYVYLFRTRDVIIADKISDVIQILDKYPNASYFLFSSFDENGDIRLTYPDHVYTQYNEAIRAHSFLLVHPSGQIYRREDMRLELYKKYIDEYFSNNLSFIAHQLIRMDLALKGDFVTSSIYAWNYAVSTRVKTVSGVIEDTREKRLNIHASIYHTPRFECEFNFVRAEIVSPYNVLLMEQIIQSFYLYNVILFPESNLNPDFNRHYNSTPTKISRINESRKFYNVASKEIDKVGNAQYRKSLLAVLVKEKFRIILLRIPKSILYSIPRQRLGRFVRSKESLLKIYNYCKNVKKGSDIGI